MYKKRYYKYSKRSLKECKELAKILGIEFLSESYSGSTSKYMWKCKNDHMFLASYNQVKNSFICWKCVNHQFRISIDIEMIKYILEHLFSQSFPRSKPGFLVSKYNPTKNLSIHGYNPYVKLALDNLLGDNLEHLTTEE